MNDFDAIQEVGGLILFVSTVVVVLVSFTLTVARHLSARLIKKQKIEITKLDWITITAGLFGISCILYGWLIEPYWLSVEHVTIKTNKLKRDQAIRIAHFSDVHSDPVKRLEDKLVEAIAGEKPDLIVFTGDAINSGSGLKNFRECITKIAKIAPTFVVKGNWDTGYLRVFDRFTDTGVIELIDKPFKLHVRGHDIWVSGKPVGSKATVADLTPGIPSADYKVFLYHYPDFIEEVEKSRIDLYLAGHTHGGQIALPGYGAIVTLSSRGKRFESGLHKFGDTYEYTNRGIGMEGGLAPRVRFFARPELTIFDITGTAK